MHQSVATINSPQFLNLQPLDINPLMSKCEIKVLYLGGNRNGSFITKEVATEIGKTLRGAPIVGYYKENKEDFSDHGEKVTIDDEGIHFQCQTKPYGFVSPVAEVWFQDFEDSDGMGNTIVRTYLMTTGYLWTGQFPESSLPAEEGRPQSMQLDKKTLKGTWETNLETGIEFFIINDAIVSKLCILGDDVEPCFEGASITAPNVSSRFTLDDNFKHTLYSMMQDLKNALNEGGQQMDNLEDTVIAEETQEEVSAEFTENQDNNNETVEEQNEELETSTVESDTSTVEEENSEDTTDDAVENEEVTEEEENTEVTEDYALIQKELEDLKVNYAALEQKYQELVEFKRVIDNKEKDALIAEFYMLSDEDKKPIVENKDQYSLEEIKAKLSVICFDKKISFTNKKDSEEEEEKESLVFSLTESEDSNLPEWVKAVKQQEKLV